jgi:hypothetical protein
MLPVISMAENPAGIANNLRRTKAMFTIRPSERTKNNKPCANLFLGRLMTSYAGNRKRSLSVLTARTARAHETGFNPTNTS